MVLLTLTENNTGMAYMYVLICVCVRITLYLKSFILKDSGKRRWNSNNSQGTSLGSTPSLFIRPQYTKHKYKQRLSGNSN